MNAKKAEETIISWLNSFENEIGISANWWKDIPIDAEKPFEVQTFSINALLEISQSEDVLFEKSFEIEPNNNEEDTEEKEVDDEKVGDDEKAEELPEESWTEKSPIPEDAEGVGTEEKTPAKPMGPACHCRMSCQKKLNEDARKELYNEFWISHTWEQRKQYIASSITEAPKQRSRCRGPVRTERRQVTLTYNFLVKGENVTVCKGMFLNTLAVSEKFVRHALNKKRLSADGSISVELKRKGSPKRKKS